MNRVVVLERLREFVTSGDIVVAVYQTLFDWIAPGPRGLDYVATGAMGMASSHGLGLALANPDRRVFVLDGDGSLLMNLGSLATIAGVAPCNLHHILFENGRYEVNGNHPIPAGELIDFAAIARACGYRTSRSVQSLEALETCLADIDSTPGPSFHVMKVVPGNSHPRNYAYIHSSEARDRFRRALANGVEFE